jgi:RND family efflux transporter MFP subunit
MTTKFQGPFDLRPLIVVAAMAVLSIFATVASAQYDGLTEPVKKIALASDESGIIQAIHVSEGDLVTAGQSLVQLNDDLQKVQLELAEHLAQSKAECVAAEESYMKRKRVCESIQKLRAGNVANESELLRAELEMSIAFAKWKTAQDELTARQIELERARVTLENRQIKAPIDGVVARIYREIGEFVSPINADVMILIDDSQLNAVFNIPTNEVKSLKVGQEVSVEIANFGTVNGRVDSIGFVVDAESQTVSVKILIDNSERRIRAGEACTLNI